MEIADYTLHDVAEQLGRSYDTVAELARAGDIPGAYQLRKRGRWAVRRGEFDRWHAGLGPMQDDPHRLEAPSKRSLAHRKRAAS